MSSPVAELDAVLTRFDGSAAMRRVLDATLLEDAAAEVLANRAAQNSFADTDMANATRLARLHGRDIRFTVGAGFLVWTGARWEVDDKNVFMQRLAKRTAEAIFNELAPAQGHERDELFRHAKRSQSRKALMDMVSLVPSEPGITVAITDFDADPWALNVSNGTVDLRSGMLRPHRQEDLITRLANVPYDAESTCPLWTAFLDRVTGGDSEMVAYLRRVVGYCLTGSTSEQVLHFLYGLGANGKSVFCEVLSRLLGDYAIIVQPEMVMARRHTGIPNDVARLRGVRLALMNETSQGAAFDEAKLKDLTGGDTITARFLHREYFDFAPSHKLMIRGNHKPTISGTDDGIWRRLRLVPFTVSIPPGQQDMQLLDKLCGELPGILRWAVDGCLEWQRDRLRPPAAVLEAVAEYRAESDTLARFLDERCERIRLGEVVASAFQKAYGDYCDECGERPLPAKDLATEMQRRGFERRQTKTGRRYLGLRLIASGALHWSERD